MPNKQANKLIKIKTKLFSPLNCWQIEMLRFGIRICKLLQWAHFPTNGIFIVKYLFIWTINKCVWMPQTDLSLFSTNLRKLSSEVCQGKNENSSRQAATHCHRQAWKSPQTVVYTGPGTRESESLSYKLKFWKHSQLRGDCLMCNWRNNNRLKWRPLSPWTSSSFWTWNLITFSGH